jgi:hypothetical protein
MIEWECEQSADGKSSTVHLLKGMRQLDPAVVAIMDQLEAEQITHTSSDEEKNE